MGATVGARIVEVVMTELMPSEDDVLEVWKPGKCEGPTFNSGGRCGSGAITGVRALAVTCGFSVSSEPLSDRSLGLVADGRRLGLSRTASGGNLKPVVSTGLSLSTMTASSSVSSLSCAPYSMLLRFRRRLSSLTGANLGERELPAPGAKSFTDPFLGRSNVDALCTRECVLTGLWAKESSSLTDLPGSVPGAPDGRERVVWSEDLEPFSESLLVIVALDTVESREGGGGTSGKAAEEGDCSLEEGTETTTGDDTAEVPPGLRPTILGLELLRFQDPEERLSVPSLAASFVPPTEALIRLYSPLKPPCTSSMPFGSPAVAGAGGAVRSSKVVRESECDAVRCSWCSVSCSDSRESLAMAAVCVASTITAGARSWA